MKEMNVRRRSYRKVWLTGIVMFVAVFLFTFLTRNARVEDEGANAASLANFDAGYIISDYQMGNYNSMTEAQIQGFLDSKINCNKGKSYYDYLVATYPGYSWHFDNGHIVCLNEEKFGDGETIGSGDTAAHIVWQAAQDYRINPQVLIVLLQKEQGLITDNYPNTRQYRSATGYGCPDTAPCAVEYYGFKNQVRKAAELFRYVLDNGSRYYPVGNKYISYNPTASCGGSVVDIKNRATSALYQYTPYQPNAAALMTGYGTAACGAYGNRNFYLYFEDWFGGVTDENPRNVNIESGIYNIKSKLVSDYGLSYQDGLIVNTDAMSSLIIEKNTTSYYTIRNRDDLYLTAIKDSSGTYLLKMQARDETNEAQSWIIYANNDDTVSFYSVLYSTMVLDVQDAATSNRTKVQLYERVGNNNYAQEWIISEDDSADLSGQYYIMSVVAPEKAIDVSNASMADGANVQIYVNSEGNVAQEWSIKKEKEGYYTITNIRSGKVLDVSNGILQSGSNVQTYTANGSCAQRWKFRENLDGTYIIKNYCNDGVVLDVQDAKTNLQIYDRTDGYNKAQRWTLKEIAAQETLQGADAGSDLANAQSLADGVYSIRPLFNTYKALDVEGGSYADGANVQIYVFSNGNRAQEWEIRRDLESDYYTIRNAYSQKALDVAGGILNNNTNIWMYSYNGSCAQRWSFQKQTDGAFVIKNACQNSMVLDVQDFYTNVQLYTGWGTNNTAQKWQLNRIR